MYGWGMNDYGFGNFNCFGGGEPQGLDWGHGGYDADCFGGWNGYSGGDDCYDYQPQFQQTYGNHWNSWANQELGYTNINMDNSRTFIQKERSNNNWLWGIGGALLGAGAMWLFNRNQEPAAPPVPPPPPPQPQVVYRDRWIQSTPAPAQQQRYVTPEELNDKLDRFFKYSQKK